MLAWKLFRPITYAALQVVLVIATKGAFWTARRAYVINAAVRV